MKISREVIIFFTITFVIYILPEIVIEDAMLYIVGGGVLAIMNEVLKLFFLQNSSYAPYLLWLFFLTVMVVVFFKLKNKIKIYLTLIIIGLLLYVIDFWLYDLVSYDSGIREKIILDTDAKAIVFTLISVVIKSLILSCVYYWRRK